MMREEFFLWMNTQYANTHNIQNNKVIGNYVSRIARIEREYQSKDIEFTLEKEYRKNGMAEMTKDFSKYGRGLKGKGINLPIDTPSIQPYIASLRLYRTFLNEYYREGRNE